MAEDGTLQHLEWSRDGGSIACWCSNMPALHFFDTHSWTSLAVVPFPGSLQLARGIIYGLNDLIHVSWEQDLSRPESVSFCRLPRGSQPFSPRRDMLQFFFSHEASDLQANPRPLYQEVMPSLSPSGSFLALIDRTLQLHIIKCSTRGVVYHKQLSLPPSNGGAGDSFERASQVQWLHGGNSLQIVTSIVNVDPPLAVQIIMLDFLN